MVPPNIAALNSMTPSMAQEQEFLNETLEQPIPANAINPEQRDVADFSSNKSNGEIIEDVSYGWVDFKNFGGGLLKGLFYGGLYGTSALGINFLLNKAQKISGIGKVTAGFAAAGALLYNMIMAKIDANKEKSDIDHILRINHNN